MLHRAHLAGWSRDVRGHDGVRAEAAGAVEHPPPPLQSHGLHHPVAASLAERQDSKRGHVGMKTERPGIGHEPDLVRPNDEGSLAPFVSEEPGHALAAAGQKRTVQLFGNSDGRVDGRTRRRNRCGNQNCQCVPRLPEDGNGWNAWSGSVAHRSGVGRTWSGAGFARGRGQWRTLVGGGEQLVGVSSTLGRGRASPAVGSPGQWHT